MNILWFHTVKARSQNVDAPTSPLIGHLVAGGRFPDNHEASASSVTSHTATISETHDQSSASTVTRSFSDGEERDLATPIQTEVYLHTVFSTSATMQRSRPHKPTARESLRRRLLETDARRHPLSSNSQATRRRAWWIFDTCHRSTVR